MHWEISVILLVLAVFLLMEFLCLEADKIEKSEKN